MPGKKKSSCDDERQSARRRIVQTVLTWSHVMAMSVLILAAIANVSGLAAIVLKPDTAEAVCEYARAWQTFLTAGILGYDAKSTVENALKITRDIKQIADAGKQERTEENNG